MKKKKERMNLAAEILNSMKRRLVRCRIVLAVSLAGNLILAAAYRRK